MTMTVLLPIRVIFVSLFWLEFNPQSTVNGFSVPDRVNNNPSTSFLLRSNNGKDIVVDRQRRYGRLHRTAINLSSSAVSTTNEDNDEAIQWDLLLKHHAKGSWKGVWTTYDYMGDVIDESVASVDIQPPSTIDGDGEKVVRHSHTIVVGAKRSDCPTCFDSMETKTLPIGEYRENEILSKRSSSRLAGVSMVNGPSLLRSGAMATELVLKHGDGRVRVIFNHAPVWQDGVEPGSCPPQGLKLFRVMMSREALRDTPPTAETETANPPSEGNPVFYRPVPPFNWHKKWSGTSWTWGPQRGNQGWNLDELDETDAWQGITPVDCWNLRLGAIHMQAPKIITDATVGICRLAWLPTDEILLRVEAGVSALQPMVLDDDTMVGFEPPSLTSLRCDMLQKIGELDEASRPFRDGGDGTFPSTSTAEKTEEKEKEDRSDISASATENNVETKPATKAKQPPNAPQKTSSAAFSDPRDALSL